ncbi:MULTISPECIES: AAA-like domain-containing protein [Aerosakkonema]|uniref:AAA-like domain-containing protein n=1 Tax=Aerosakkonema TaxID=1246629 RepID=UPI0035BB059B
MEFQSAIQFADAAIFAQTNRHLKTVELMLMRGAWSGQTYQEIAATIGYTPEYLQHDVGPNLWKILSKIAGEKVNKNNFRAVIERWCTSKLNYAKEEAIVAGFFSGYTQPINNQISQGTQCSNLAIAEIAEITTMDMDFLPRYSTRSATTLELPRGQVPIDSNFYIQRPPIELHCLEEISQPGGLVRIEAPRQMGKTSLMARIINQAKKQGYRTVLLNLQLAEREIFKDLNRFLEWFCASVGQSLQLPNRIAHYWDDCLGTSYNTTVYFEKYLLAKINGPVVMAIDEMNRIFQYPEIAWDFLGMLRGWYEKARYGESVSNAFEKLRSILINSGEIDISAARNLSAFNAGLLVKLSGFNFNQIKELADIHGLYWEDSQVEKLMNWVGGHPYLVRVALYHIARKDLTLPQLLQTATTQFEIYKDHLQRQWWYLQQDRELAQAYSQIVTRESLVSLDLEPALNLESIGLVKLINNQAIPSCELYRQYFRDRLHS